MLKSQTHSVPLLEREITISQNNQSIQSVLAAISQHGGFLFSYNPEAINASSIISVNIRQKSVRHALNTIFNGNVKYKVKDKYIILQKNKEGTSPAKKGEEVIEGYVYDSGSGKKVTQTSVYDKNLSISAITDDYGYFRIALPSGESHKNLHFSKEGYADTTLVAIAGKSSYVSIELSSLPVDSLNSMLSKKKIAAKHSLMPMPAWLVPQKILVHTRNLSDSIFKNVQFSLIPYVTTNKLLTGKTINNFSVNMTVGVVQGVKKVEVGGIMNIVRDDASFCELAGLGNIVGGNAKGFQAAGVINRAQSLRGVQAAGIINLANEGIGAQMAGIFNKIDTMKGVPADGIVNSASRFKGIQMAGIANSAKDITGAQVAGICNISGRIDGMQVSGIFNRASYISGTQVSLINIADSAVGVPVGLFSFVRNGYHKLEIGEDESLFTTLAFRSGVQHLHTIFLVGTQAKSLDNPISTVGFGIGTSFGEKGRLLWDLDLTSQELLKGDDLSFTTHLYRFYAGVDKPLTGKTSISVGINLNALLLDMNSNDSGNRYASVAPYTILEKTFHGVHQLKTWAGLKVSFRFF